LLLSGGINPYQCAVPQGGGLPQDEGFINMDNWFPYRVWEYCVYG